MDGPWKCERGGQLEPPTRVLSDGQQLPVPAQFNLHRTRDIPEESHGEPTVPSARASGGGETARAGCSRPPGGVSGEALRRCLSGIRHMVVTLR